MNTNEDIQLNKKDSRQVPKVEDICANKKYHDILYAYLQTISERSVKDGKRYLNKKDINYSKIGLKLNLTRQTVSKKFSNLLDMGLIVACGENYEIVELDRDMASLIPYETLKLLVDALSEYSVSTYIYFFNRYYANEFKSFKFTLAQVKKYIGICDTTRSNDDTITNILFTLQKLGLIKYQLTAESQEDNFNNIKTIYQLEWLTNKVI